MADPESVEKAIRRLSKKRVYVGIPQENDPRPGEDIGNASLGYIHEYGSPLRNIPARPFLNPGVADAMPEISKYLKEAATAALAGNEVGVDAALGRAGAAGMNAVHMKIQAGIPPPITQQTVRRSRTVSRRAGTPADATPLYDTGKLLAAIVYVVRSK